jgi:hypothetical protein
MSRATPAYIEPVCSRIPTAIVPSGAKTLLISPQARMPVSLPVRVRTIDDPAVWSWPRLAGTIVSL